MDLLEPVFLSRIQFAFTISFHIIFPSFTIGLAGYLAVIEYKYLKTKKKIYQEIYKFWVKIFAITFGMGVVSGIVMPYEFGTNWANFSAKTSNVIGPLMSFEILTAFFLEASFLAIMLFGFKKVSKKIHFASTIIVAIGTIISSFWILSVNSWMQTPSGFEYGEDGIFYASNWLQIIFNPSFIYRFFHVVIGSYLTTAFVIAGVGAYFLLKKKTLDHAKIMFSMAIFFIIIFIPLQALIGDMHGINSLKYQPAKIAAIEGLWQDTKGADFILFGIPSSQEEKIKYSVKIPNLASLVLTHEIDGEIKGLENWQKEERPPVGVVFFSFRIMLFCAFIMIITAIIALYLKAKNRLFESKKFHKFCIIISPIGFIAILSGWFVTEVGRQPYLVYGYLKTSEAVSNVDSSHILFSTISFIAIYTLIFSAAAIYIWRLIKKGVEE